MKKLFLLQCPYLAEHKPILESSIANSMIEFETL